MPDTPAHQGLHVPSLSVTGFRGFLALDLPRLARVTLIAGANGVGKTSILDAVSIYAARGDMQALNNILADHDETKVALDERGHTALVADLNALFFAARGSRYASSIKLGPVKDEDNSLTITGVDLPPDTVAFLGFNETEPAALQLTIGDRQRIFRPVPQYGTADFSDVRMELLSGDAQWPAAIPCQYLGPTSAHRRQLAHLWDSITFTPRQDIAIQLLELVVADEIEGLAMVGDTSAPRYRYPVAKLRGHRGRTPVKRLGDGAFRLFGIALGLANAAGGVLLIDEVENGIHHSIQPKLWGMIFEAAEAADVQIVATTHSWDCVVAFAQAAVDSDAEGALYRIDSTPSGIDVVDYSEESLAVAAHQGIEVR